MTNKKKTTPLNANAMREKTRQIEYFNSTIQALEARAAAAEQKVEELERSLEAAVAEAKAAHQKELDALINEGASNQSKAQDQLDAGKAALKTLRDDFERR